MKYSRNNINGVQFSYNNQDLYAITVIGEYAYLNRTTEGTGIKYTIDEVVKNLNNGQSRWYPVKIEELYEIF